MTNVVLNTGRLLLLSRKNQGHLLINSPFRKRLFYGWLIEVFNSKDAKRAKEIGPDRAAAEWIIRNGGKVKFASSVSLTTHFTSIPSSGESSLVEIHAKDVALTNSGLSHLEGLENLEWLDLNGCKHISDLSHLKEVAESLKHLNIGNCAGLSDLSPVVKLTKLETLILTDTLGGDKRTGVIETIKRELPNCDVVE